MRKKYTTPMVCLYGTLDDFIKGTPNNSFAHDLYSTTCANGTIIAVDCETDPIFPLPCQYFAGKGMIVGQDFSPCP